MISRQNQSVDNTNITPPPVPPRPNKDLIRERLLHTDVKENLIGIETIDEKKENRYINFLTYSHIYSGRQNYPTACNLNFISYSKGLDEIQIVI